MWARRSGSWSARSTAVAGSPGTSTTQPSRRRRRRGASRRRASSATSGSGQRCWWTSICTLLLKVSVNRLSGMAIMRPPGPRCKPWMGARPHSRAPSGGRVPWREVPERQKRRATIRELAEKTGLSTAAVSYALRGMHVSAETEERVRERPPSWATRRIRSRARCAGVRPPSWGCWWAASPISGIRSSCARFSASCTTRERSTLVADADGEAERELELGARLVDHRVDGLIVLPVGPASGGWESIAQEVPP